MSEILERIIKEKISADHLLYVSMKYTKTCDVMINIIKRWKVMMDNAFDGITKSDYCSYTILPLGRDKRKRKICLYECLEGARTYAYAHQNVENEKIKIKVYGDAKRVRIDGADAIIEVPSRTNDA